MLSSNDIKYFKLAVGDNIRRETDVDISARCPICGDSKRSQSKARLHLYSKNNLTFVNCFNGGCPCQNKTVYSFLRDFYPDLFRQYKSERARSKIQELNNEDVFKNIIKPQAPARLATFDFSKIFVPYANSSECLEYVHSRGIYKPQKWFYSTKNLQIGEKFYRLENCLIIPLYIGDKWYGFYSRNISEKRFFTYMPEANNGYKIFNWFNIDKVKPTYIFEGIFDALSAIESGLSNCVACMGARIPADRLNELKKPVFCLDNDCAGLSNMLQYAKQGYTCCVPSFQDKDMNEYYLHTGNVKDEILGHTYPGVVAQVKISAKL